MRWLVVVLVCLVSQVASADVGVVMLGEAPQSAAVKKAITKWLRQHGHDVVDAGLSKQSIATLADCFTVSDLGCARTVVEKHASAENIVSVRIDDSIPAQLQLAGAWIAKGKNVVSVQRVCDECSDETIPAIVDSLLQDLSRAGDTGRIRVTSTPAGLQVLLDNQRIGITPLERDVAAGTHTLKLVQDGRTIGKKRVEVRAGSVMEVPIRVTGELEYERSYAVPATTTIIGISALIAGIALYASTQEPTGATPTYTDYKPAGIGTAAGGVAVLGLSVYLWVRSSSGSTPTVAATASGVYAGWAGSF